jgi:Cu2+-exporting ATPase
VVSKLKEQALQGIESDSFESVTGRGVQGIFAGERYLAGNKKMLTENGIRLPVNIETVSARLQSEAKTVIYFTDHETILATIAVADRVKSTSKAAIQSLQSKGIEVYMLTGDNEQTAKAVATQVDVRHYRAEVLPSQKAEFITELQKTGKVVAMVGDGINDAQALAQADVSIAMGKGSDIAMDVAKMTLITSDLQSIPKALTLSRKTVMGIRQNLFWAFIYNVVGIPIAAGILYPLNGFLLNPMIAGAAMALSSLSVVANSLRLRSAKL